MTNILALLCMAAKFLLFRIINFVLQICQLLVVFRHVTYQPTICGSNAITNKNQDKLKNKLGLSFCYFTLK